MTFTMPPPPPGFDPLAEFDDLSEPFTAVPRSSHRPGERELSSLLALGLLTLYLSNRTNWKVPNPEQLARKYSEGAARIRAANKEIEAKGFMVRYRMQDSGGQWKTHVRVNRDPEKLAHVRKWAAELEQAQAAYAAARKAAGVKGGGRSAAAAAKAAGVRSSAPEAAFPQVGPDARDGDSVHRDSVDRQPVRRDVIGTHGVEDHSEKKKNLSLSDVQNQEAEQTAEYVRDDPRHYPTLTDVEQALLAEVVAAAPLWSERLVLRVLGSDRIREITSRDPELVRRAFLLGAQNSTPGRETVTTPMRMWHVDRCPHWAAALRQLTAERSGAAAPPTAKASPIVDRPARPVPAANEPPVAPTPAGEDPRALARANAARPPSAPPARRSRVPKPAQPSEDAAARAATEEARAKTVAALAEAFPGEVPAPA